MHFLNPLVLGGLALASVPIIIHLLNRRRFLRIEWAPMRYLKLTIKTNRRRMRLEHLILLALRTLAVIFLILTVARPVLSQTGLRSWLSTKTRTSRVVVLDDSLSMGYQADHRAAFDAAKQVAADLLRDGGTQDAVTVLVTSAPQAPLVRESHLDDRSKVLDMMARLQLTDTPSDWPRVFQSLDGLLGAATFTEREVLIVTDLRRSGWSGEVRAIADKWSAAGWPVSLRVIDVGSRLTQNVALVGFECEEPVVLPGAAVRIKARVRNDTGVAITGATAMLDIAGETRPVLLPELPPGQSTEIPLNLSFAKPGQFPVHLTLPADELPQDNSRWLAVTVRPTLDIMLVDGEPSPQPFESETDFLALSFGVGGDAWHVRRLTDAEFQSAAPAPTHVLVFANVASLSVDQVATIERRVRAGMGLMVFPGEQIDTSVYNQRLYRNGAGLLPAMIESIVDGPVTGLVIDPADGSPLDPLRRLVPAALSRIAAKRYLAVSVKPGQSDARVLAHWNDPDAHPAVIEKRFGHGRVILWTVTADKQWGDWPIDPTYVLATRAAAAAIAGGETRQVNLSAGESMRYQLEADQVAIDPTVQMPGTDVSEPAAFSAADASVPVIHFDSAVRIGAYTLSWKTPGGNEESHLFSVSPPEAESDLEPLEDRQLNEWLAALHPTIMHFAAGQSLTGPPGREIWKSLASTLLVMLVAETALAVWVGRER